MTDILSYRDTVQLVQDFLEVSFHTILYIRQVYPPELFQQRKKYDNIPIYQSRNPALNDYLGKVINCIGQELLKGSLKKVALVIKEDKIEEKPLERFVWDFDWLIPVESIPAPGQDWTPLAKGLKRAQVEDEFRAFLFKLNVAESYLMRLPPDITFTVIIELTDEASPPESDAACKGHVPNEWIPAQQRYAPKGGNAAEGEKDGRSTVAPLRTARLGMINLQMMVEELEDKFGSQAMEVDDEKGRRAKDKGKGRAP